MTNAKVKYRAKKRHQGIGSSVSQRKAVTMKKVTPPFAHRLYKGFFKKHTNKSQQTHTKRGAIRCQCLMEQTWGNKNPMHLFLFSFTCLAHQLLYVCPLP